jgi:hypothetical protein
MTIEYKILPASAGAKWISQALAFSMKHPKPLALMTFLYLMAMFVVRLLSGLPAIGWIINIGMLLAVPAASLGLFSVIRGIDQGKPLSFGLFLCPIKEKPDPLLICGGLYILGYLVLIVLTASILGLGFNLTSPTTHAGVANMPIINNLFNVLINLIPSFLLVLILILFFTIVFIFTPILIGWQGVSALKAFRLSLLSCLNNWKALSVNGGIWLLIGLGVAIVTTIIIGILEFISKNDLALIFLFVICLAFVFVTLPIGFANTYYSYKAIFSEEEEFHVE